MVLTRRRLLAASLPFVAMLPRSAAWRVGSPPPPGKLTTTRASPSPAGASPGHWAIKADVPTPRSEVAAASVGNRIFVLGGYDPAAATANEEYDPATDTWRQRSVIPIGLNHAGAAAIGDKLYLVGGYGGGSRPLDSLLEYEPAADAWRQLAPLPTARGALAVATLDDRLYVLGGVSADGLTGKLEVYNPVSDHWEERQPMPTARDHFALAAVGGKLYAIGGRLGDWANNVGTNEEGPLTHVEGELLPIGCGSREGCGVAPIAGAAAGMRLVPSARTVAK
jgi:hypothetical protein